MRARDCACGRELQRRIEHAEKDERCIRRAAGMSTSLAIFSVLGLAYSSVFHPEFFNNIAPATVRVFVALLITSGISLVGFFGFWIWNRAICNRLYTEARKLIISRQSAPISMQSAAVEPASESNPALLRLPALDTLS